MRIFAATALALTVSTAAFAEEQLFLYNWTDYTSITDCP